MTSFRFRYGHVFDDFSTIAGGGILLQLMEIQLPGHTCSNRYHRTYIPGHKPPIKSKGDNALFFGTITACTCWKVTCAVYQAWGLNVILAAFNGSLRARGGLHTQVEVCRGVLHIQVEVCR
jgi:hypothetical protein